MAYKKDWSEYYDITRSKPPRDLLIEALRHVSHKGKAIDIGGGALRDTKFLLENGFDVTVIDSSPLLEKEVEKLTNSKLHAIVSSFEEYNFPENEFDVASAMYSLPFCNPHYFNSVFEKIKKSLKPGAIFCGTLFGDRDAWADNPKMTYHTKSAAEALFMDMQVIKFEEEEKDDTTARGETKHWHAFHFIAKKI